MADKEEVLKKGIYYFDCKPFIVKEWNENLELDTSTISSLPIWVQFPDLDVKYWGVESLSKLENLIGIPLKTDKQTRDKTFLSYARLLIHIPLEGPFMEYVDYINEKGRVIRQRVKYEWQPVKCDHCSMYGHIEEKCMKKKVVRQEWRVVNQKKEKRQEQQHISTEFVTLKRTARRSSPNIRGIEEPATNSFQALLENEILDMLKHNGTPVGWKTIAYSIKEHTRQRVLYSAQQTKGYRKYIDMVLNRR
ncbi:hypothetical protein Cgig2_007572 [Carnegiea gigantea]|uniref:DUF4283 domain-containing protein n=1 Tax=Carnegiea gigantea TaxID=171969 RepID=A0A9Q1GMI2_9CARY|nr:hypothetical protein Cgig2_007572 [Carnegiea gigantea]